MTTAERLGHVGQGRRQGRADGQSRIGTKEREMLHN